jgi:hypothetical protein
MRYWIFDQDDTPQRFPLQRLLRCVREASGARASACRIYKVRGYGEEIHTWEVALDVAESMEVDLADLDSLSAGGVEWFYDLEAQIEGSGILFGLHDSTALFVEGDSDVIGQIASTFAQVRPAVR